jgi:hypothetical protein
MANAMRNVKRHSSIHFLKFSIRVLSTTRKTVMTTETAAAVVNRRYDFVLLFDVQDGRDLSPMAA